MRNGPFQTTNRPKHETYIDFHVHQCVHIAAGTNTLIEYDLRKVVPVSWSGALKHRLSCLQQ